MSDFSFLEKDIAEAIVSAQDEYEHISDEYAVIKRKTLIGLVDKARQLHVARELFEELNVNLTSKHKMKTEQVKKLNKLMGILNGKVYE